jgi:membrane protein
VLRTIAHNTIQHGLSGAASAMAYDVFLGMIPLLAFMGWIAGWLARTGRPIAYEVGLLDLAPGPAAELARSQLYRIEDATTFAPVVLLGFLWLSSSGTHVALATVRGIVGLPPRTYARTRLLALALTVAGVAFAALASAAAVVLHQLEAIGRLSETEQAVWRVVLLGSTLFVTTFGCATLYRVSSGRKWNRRSILPGALLAALGFHLVSWAFSTYVTRLARYTAFYGGLAAVAVLMVWLWLSSLTVLIGAEANAVLDEHKGKTPLRRADSVR